MEYIKHIKGNLYDIRQVESIEKEQELLNNGYYPSDVTPQPTIDEFHQLVQKIEFDEENKRCNHYWEETINVIAVKDQISVCKQQLADTDYKVIKNMEYQMAMMTCSEPNTIILDLYDAQELHKERQAIRDKINNLETLLSSKEQLY